jgi:hypothetical protein
MASPTNSVLLEAAAVESLVRMNSEQLDRDECDAASDVLFGILSGRSHQDPTPSGKVAGISSKSPTGGISIPLSSPEDADYLSPLQCYIRAHCVEYFEATESEGVDSKSPSKNQQQRGRRTPIVVGRVGIRCVFCKDYPFNERASQSTAFPSNLDKIYSSVVVSAAMRIACVFVHSRPHNMYAPLSLFCRCGSAAIYPNAVRFQPV